MIVLFSFDISDRVGLVFEVLPFINISLPSFAELLENITSYLSVLIVKSDVEKMTPPFLMQYWSQNLLS